MGFYSEIVCLYYKNIKKISKKRHEKMCHKNQWSILFGEQKMVGWDKVVIKIKESVVCTF